jgi:hypothetical protein
MFFSRHRLVAERRRELAKQTMPGKEPTPSIGPEMTVGSPSCRISVVRSGNIWFGTGNRGSRPRLIIRLAKIRCDSVNDWRPPKYHYRIPLNRVSHFIHASSVLLLRDFSTLSVVLG